MTTRADHRSQSQSGRDQPRYHTFQEVPNANSAKEDADQADEVTILSGSWLKIDHPGASPDSAVQPAPEQPADLTQVTTGVWDDCLDAPPDAPAQRYGRFGQLQRSRVSIGAASTAPRRVERRSQFVR